MERRSPTAVLLLLLLLSMLPLGGAACDVHCGVTRMSMRLSLGSQSLAKHECCHTSHATMCAPSQPQGAMEAAAARAPQISASLIAAAVAALPVDVAPQESAGRRSIELSPPGSEIARNQMPLRI